MKRLLLLLIVVVVIVAFGFSLISVQTGSDVNASAILSDLGSDTSGYSRAVAQRDWQFPQDFGAHPDFQTEWWYYTGNVATADGRRFGYQFTIFRRSISPTEPDTKSEWRTNQLYMAHFAVTDVSGNQFFHDERFSRGGAGLAGAEIDPTYRVWLDNWQAIGTNADDSQTQITASTAQAAVALTLQQTKPPALQGDHGLSAKSAEPGNASYYYSLTRLQTSGTITLGGQAFTVSGATWMDHEFGTSALGSDAIGWDWFGLQLNDQRELMVGQIRNADKSKDPYFGGLLVNPDGSTQYLPSSAITIQATGTWTSPHTGATYPAGWNVSVDLGSGAPLKLTITPQIADQELNGNGIAYWEGSVKIAGDATGYGYTELTGYADSMVGRF
ncbi:MAG TPA: lipocalin-like domain-containing protein [Phototrophicaceae bacterium]|nr:lipocalin-like domain-containing protein [Phototrophicaceae bacterium]